MFYQSAKKKNKRAIYLYGKMVFNGECCDPDYDVAIKIFEIIHSEGFRDLIATESFHHVEKETQLFLISKVIFKMG